MQEFIEKLIGRLETEIKKIEDEPWRDYDERTIEQCTFVDAISIVDELAEEYKDKTSDEWQIIYGKVCNLEKKYAESDESMGNANFCFTLKQLLRYFKEELREEEHKGGWIPCSERLPEEEKEYLVCFETDLISISKYSLEDGFAKRYRTYIAEPLKPIAWQPLPEPYNPKGE